jgi:alpha-tubulin suppressor-like RCC1 family protein
MRAFSCASVFLAVAACDPGVRVGSPCELDSDCPGLLVCRASRCRTQCLSDRDCTLGEEVCIGGGCVAIAEGVDGGAIDGGPADAGPIDAGAIEDAGADAPSEPDGGVRWPVVDVSAGQHHTCAVLADRRVACWGRNTSGQLGDGTITSRSLPVVVTAWPHRAARLSTAEATTCAATETGAVYCWGANAVPTFTGASQFGNGTTADQAMPTTPTALPAGRTAIAIASGWWHSCAALDMGVRCWGQNRTSELGDGTTTQTTLPVAPLGFETIDTIAVAAGDGPSCAIVDTDALPGGDLYCWGYGIHGEVGAGSGSRAMPTAVILDPPEAPNRFLSVDLGGMIVGEHGGHGCAIRDGGQLYCWGRNTRGQVGTGAAERGDQPYVRRLATSDYTAVSAGGQHTCAVGMGSQLFCWGANDSGQTGADPVMVTERLSFIVPPVDLPGTVARVSAGGEHTCAILDDRRLYCWGDDGFGQLGNDATMMDQPTPQLVDFSAILP